MPVPAAPRPHSKLTQTIGENLGAFKGYDLQSKLDVPAANFF
jgi:hypothetical protein